MLQNEAQDEACEADKVGEVGEAGKVGRHIGSHVILHHRFYTYTEIATARLKRVRACWLLVKSFIICGCPTNLELHLKI